nr:hypothetical protein [Tanacetum cinerariifolium]
MSKPHPKRNFVPRTYLMRSGFKTLNTARQNSSRAVVSVNTARQINTTYPRPIVNSARPMSYVFNRAHSHDKRPIDNRTTSKNSKINQKINTVRVKHVNIARPKVNTARPKAKLNVVQGNQAYTYYCQLKVNAARHKLTTDVDVNVVEVNPTIYTSCIEQFWATTTTKNINREAQIHTKVDGKKVIISEATIRRDLKFEDEGGVDCLSNEVIFEQLPLMGYENLSQKLTFYKAFFSQQWKFLIHTILQWLSAKTIAWNEFSSTMASAIIYLATDQKFNFSKYIFDSMIKHLDSGTKFLMFPMVVQVFLDKQVDDTKIPTDTQRIPTIIQPTTSQPQRKQKPRKTRRKDTELPQTSVPIEVVADEVVYEKMYDSVKRVVTTATGLDTEHDRGIISKTQFTATLNEPSSIRTSSGSGPRHQETMGDAAAQTRVLNLKTTKTTQAKEISSLKRRVKRLEKKKKSRTHGIKRLYKVSLSARVESSTEEQSLDKEDASKQGRNIADIDADAKTTLVDETAEDQWRNNDQEMFDTGVLDDEEVIVEKAVVVKEIDAAQDQVSVVTTIVAKDLTVDDITLAKVLEALKTIKLKIRGIVVRDHEEPSKSKTTTTPTSVADNTRPKAKGIVVQKPIEATTTTIIIPTQVKDNGNGKIVEPEMPLKKKAQISLDEELAFKLQAEQEEEERIAREKALEANIIEWDDVQAMMDADYELAARLQKEEQRELTIKEKSRLFVELMDKRRSILQNLKQKKREENL